MRGLEARAQESFDLFISYAHADDADGQVSRFVELLRQVRDTQQYRSWQIFFDQKAIVAGDDWQQRLTRVKAAGALIVLMSPNYFRDREPQWCRWEWQAFREQEQKPPHLERIFPVYLSTEASLEAAACHDDWRRDLARRQFVDLRDFWGGRGDEPHVRQILQRLERTISDRLKDHAHQRQMRRLGIPYQSFPLPPYFVPRPDDLNRVRQALLSPESGTGLVMSAVYGMGGIGKTTLAADLVRQADVRDHFEDGILWATLGQNPEPRQLLSQWIVALGDHNFRSSEAGDYQTHLRSLLQHRKMLLVIDDAWSSEHVNWFRVGGERCRVLVTTRDAGIARAIHAAAYDLDVMTPEQSRALITGRLGRPLQADEVKDAAALAEEVGRLPLALELIAAQVADGIPWDDLREDLRREVARLCSLDLPIARDADSDEKRKNHSLLASVNLSLGRLKPPILLERFAWLGVVPDDAVVNPLMTATLWGMDERTARDELRYLREKALLLAAPAVRVGEREHPGYRLHDLLHDAAHHLLTSPKQPEEERQLPGLELELPAAHSELLSRYRRRTQQGQWHTLPEDGYIHRRLAWHFEQARDAAGLHGLLREETADGRNGWFEVNDRRGEMAVFADDVTRAWRLAEEARCAGRTAPMLGLQVRSALVSGSLNQMAGNLPAELIEALVQKQLWPPAQGLAYANRIPEPKNRADALTRLAPLFPKAERGMVLAEAIAAVRHISDERDRSGALAVLAPHLPEDLLAETLTVARKISYEFNRSRALVGLAPHLPEALLAEALDAARQIKNEDDRSSALGGLAPHLSEDLLAEALAAVRQINAGLYRSRALAALAQHLPAAHRAEVLTEALAAARRIGEEDNRSRALAELVPHLPEPLLAEALVATRQIERGEHRCSALEALVPHLPKALLAEALAAASQIERPDLLSRALKALAPHLPEPLLTEAFAVARRISLERYRSEALVGLAPHPPLAQRTEVQPEAHAATRRIHKEDDRSRALAAALAPHTPPDQQTKFLTRALAAARQISDDFERWMALAALTPHPPATQRAKPPVEALAAARQISNEFHRSEALVELVPHLPAAQQAEVLAEALAAARQLNYEEDRSRALAALAQHLPAAHRAEVLTEALAAARRIGEEDNRSRALAELVPHLPEPLLAEALVATRQISYEFYRSRVLVAVAPRLPAARRTEVLANALAAARRIGLGRARSEALEALAPQLSGALLAEALVAARQISDERDRARALVGLAPHLPEALLAEALDAARQISAEEPHSKALVGLAPHLPEAQLAKALAAARQFNTEPRRSQSIMTIVSHMSSLSRDEQLQFWSESLRGLASQGRKPILEAQKDLLRLLKRLTGVDVSAEVAEIAHAIRDVGRWFP